MRPLDVASSSSTLADPVNVARIGPSLTRMYPFTWRSPFSVSSAPGRHDATRLKSERIFQTSGGGRKMTKLSSKWVHPSRVTTGLATTEIDWTLRDAGGMGWEERVRSALFVILIVSAGATFTPAASRPCTTLLTAFTMPI